MLTALQPRILIPSQAFLVRSTFRLAQIDPEQRLPSHDDKALNSEGNVSLPRLASVHLRYLNKRGEVVPSQKNRDGLSYLWTARHGGGKSVRSISSHSSMDALVGSEPCSSDIRPPESCLPLIFRGRFRAPVGGTPEHVADPQLFEREVSTLPWWP
jgi:hypothetical protein